MLSIARLFHRELLSPLRPAVYQAAADGLTATIEIHARHAAVVAGLNEMGDRFLRRIRLHGAPDGTFSEQFSRNTGYMTGAQDLTWSYAALLTAMEQR